MDPILAALLAGGGLMLPTEEVDKRKDDSFHGTSVESKLKSMTPEIVNKIVDDWDIYNQGPLSPTEAFRILRRPARRSQWAKGRHNKCGDKNQNPKTPVSLILLLGLWNTKISCGPSQQGARLIQLLKFALSQNSEEVQNNMTEDYEFSLSTVVLNDQDEEFLDFTIDGPYHCPSMFPALAMYMPPTFKQNQEANRNQIKIHLSSRLVYVPISSHTMRLLLTDHSEDERVGGHTEKDSLLLFNSLTQTIEVLRNMNLQDYLNSEEANALMLAVSMGGSSALEMARKQQSSKRSKAIPSPLCKPDPPEPPPHSTCIRIFIAGDRSQVGKSSVCLGLLGSFLHLGYKPSQLAYIKPATQCEATQLVAQFCEHHGISCTPIGPIVYYKGFTREFLEGNTETSSELLAKVTKAVDQLSIGRQILIIDGVGYPAVGSVCGTSNASVAQACGYPLVSDPAEGSKSKSEIVPRRLGAAPVLLVGKSGVGDAIDSYNLNSTYFEASSVPVLGAVFNRLPTDGYYSLENCKEAVETYFEKSRPGEKAFGFIPEVDFLKPSIPSEPHSKSQSSDEPDTPPIDKMELAAQFVIQFLKHVNVIQIIGAAKQAQSNILHSDGLESVIRYAKRLKLEATIEPQQNTPQKALKTREEIENEARAAGAKSS